MTVLILHGVQNHRPPQHWQFLLAAGLVQEGVEVRYPQLPDADAPLLDRWLDTLRTELVGVTTVVCHSLSCLLFFHAAGSVDPVERLLLVAPPASEAVPEAAATFRIGTPDGSAVRASAGEIMLIGSDNDPYNADGVQTRYGDPLGLTALVLPGAGHITPDSGFGPWPWALSWCLAEGR